MTERAEPAGAEHTAGAQQHRWDVVDTVDDAVGDRRRGPEDHDERDRPLSFMEQDDCERDPR